MMENSFDMITIYTNFVMTSISVWTGNSEDTNLYFHMEQMKTCVPEAGPRFNIKTVFPRYGIPMLKIRRSWDRLIFNMGIRILTSLFWNGSQVSRAETSNYTPQYLRGVIPIPAFWHQVYFFHYNAGPLLEPMLTHHHCHVAFIWKQFHKNCVYVIRVQRIH